MRIPFSAPIPLPTIKAVGVARPKAHGQAITRTATAAKIARVIVLKPGLTQGKNKLAHTATCPRASGNKNQETKLAQAIISTAGTK